MTAPLSLDLTARVAKLLPRLASDQSGEIVATAAAIARTLKAAGHDLHDLAEHVSAEPRTVVVYRERPVEPRPPRDFDYESWRRTWAGRDPRTADRHRVTRCQQSGGLSTWEAGFLASLAQRLSSGRDLTPRQRETLDDIAAKVGGRT